MTIEREFFDWDGWDGDAECMMFYNPVLKAQVGKYPAGTKFAVAFVINSTNGCKLQFINREIDKITGHFGVDKVMGEYNLHYRIGETISEAG
jgi:hypothetical protein